MPTHQSQREQIAHMKLIPVRELIKDKSLLLMMTLSFVELSWVRQRNSFTKAERKKSTSVRHVRRYYTDVNI